MNPSGTSVVICKRDNIQKDPGIGFDPEHTVSRHVRRGIKFNRTAEPPDIGFPKDTAAEFHKGCPSRIQYDGGYSCTDRSGGVSIFLQFNIRRNQFHRIGPGSIIDAAGILGAQGDFSTDSGGNLVRRAGSVQVYIGCIPFIRPLETGVMSNRDILAHMYFMSITRHTIFPHLQSKIVGALYTRSSIDGADSDGTDKFNFNITGIAI